MIKLIIFWYFTGLLVFLTAATFYPQVYNTWARAFWLWAKIDDVLLMCAILIAPQDNKLIKPLIWMAVARVLWAIGGWITGLEANNNKIVGILFLTLLVICLSIIVKEVWRKQNW